MLTADGIGADVHRGSSDFWDNAPVLDGKQLCVQ